MLRLTFVLIFGLCFAVVSYSAIRTILAAPNARPLMSAITLAILAILVAFEWITADQASKGTAASLYSLLPGIISWSTKSGIRIFFVSILSMAVAAFMYWLGPHSLHRIHIRTDKAKFVRLTEKGDPIPCDDWYSTELWKPGSSWEKTVSQVRCLTANQRPWKPTLNGRILECGEPLDPTLISNGIDISNLTSRTIENRRIREGIKSLRQHFDTEVPSRDVEDILLIATWNLRKFGTGSLRIPEAYYYIAEIVSHFDIVAVQEIEKDITQLHKLLDLLGDNWNAVYSLISPGSWQRMAFIYDKHKVRLGPMIASVVVMGEEQLTRTPYAVTFDVFGQRLTLCTVHIVFGGVGGHDRVRRVREIQGLGDYLVKMVRFEPTWKGSLILLGDFNTPDINSLEIEAIKNSGFYLDPDLAALPSNYRKNRVYDQIAFLKGESDNLHIGRVGVFDFFADIFKDENELNYRAEMGEKYLQREGDNDASTQDARQRFYRDRWRTYQVSDHLPKWAEIRLLRNKTENKHNE